MPSLLPIALGLLIGVPRASGMLDFRHFANSHVRTVAFDVPSSPPPSFIYAAEQLAPPYDLSKPTLEPFPGCEARYATLCAIQHSIRLVTRARTALCPELAAGGTRRQAALDQINTGAISAEGTSGFALVAFLENGTILADGLQPDLVGTRIDGVLASGLVAQTTLLDYIAWVTQWNGGFVPHFTTRISLTPINVFAGEAPQAASLYVEQCPTGERFGVAFGREPLPGVELCSPFSNGLCAIQNIRRLSGLALVDALNCAHYEEHQGLHHGISFTPHYTVGDFYTFIYHLSNWGYPGPDPKYNDGPLEDTLTTTFSHNALKHALAGRNITDVGLSYDLQVTVNSAAWVGGAWRTYPWNTPALGAHFKLTLFTGFVWNGTGYYIGTGSTHGPAARAGAANCEVCSADFALTCSVTNSMLLASHTLAELLTPQGVWPTITNDEWFGAMHANRPAVQNFSGTWPAGFYVFAYDYNGTCVADGKIDTNVGKNASYVLSDAVHEKLITIADGGSGWHQFALSDGIARMAFVVKVAKWGRFFYAAVAFIKEPAAWVADCTAAYSEPCSSANAEALVGLVSADVLSAADEASLSDVIQSVGNRTGRYASAAVGDFRVDVYDDQWGCSSFATTGSTVCQRPIPSTWLPLLEAAGREEASSWVQLPAVDRSEDQAAFVFRVDHSRLSTVLMLVAYVGAAPGPPRCDPAAAVSGCPASSLCSASGRCLCDHGFRANFTPNASFCGTLPPATMSCHDVGGSDCSAADGSCRPCTEGYFCPDGEPLPCPAGQFCPAGSASPSLCMPGTVSSTPRATSVESCLPCPAGTSQPRGGQLDCIPCKAGTFSTSVRSTTCTRCDVGLYQDAVGSTTCKACLAPLTTVYQSATVLADCVCPPGMFQPIGSRSCSSCPEGMTCTSANCSEAAIPDEGAGVAGPFPSSDVGFMAYSDMPLAPYKCKDSSWCPGGRPEHCAKNRDPSTVGCSKCLPGMSAQDDGSCTVCEKGSVAFKILLVIMAALVGLIGLVVLVNRNQVPTSSSATSCVIMLGLTITAMQTLGVFQNLTLRWIEPLKSMFKVSGLVSFDLDILQTGCMIGSGSVQNFALRLLVAPGLACCIALAVWVKKRVTRDTESSFAVDAVNSIGSVFQVFFVSIAVSCFTPFVCYKHPGDNGHSMVSDPSVLCFDSAEHDSLLSVTVVSVLTVLFPYLTVTGWAALRYRSAVSNSATAYRHLRMFRFLFFRYNPDAYWYGIVILYRGLFICLVPVVAGDSASMQIVAMCVILMSFSAVQLYNKPWRSTLPNIMDGVIVLLTVLLLITAAMSTDFSDVDDVVGSVGAAVFAAVFVAVVSALGYSVYRRLIPSQFFHRYICHHKADAAAQARILQMMLVSRTKQTCFLDSDNLTNLEQLVDIVRTRIGCLIVYLTADTLRRPWCACEVTVTYQTHQKLMTVVTPSFKPPTVDEIKVSAIRKYMAIADFDLLEYGVSDDFIGQAFRWALSEEVASVDMPVDVVGRARFELVTEGVLGGSASVTSPNTPSDQVNSHSLVLSSLIGDDEATASAAILIRNIEASVRDIIPAGIVFLADMPDAPVEKVSAAVAAARSVIVLLSSGSLESVHQLQVIVDAVTSEVPCIPVNTPSFRFASRSFFNESLQQRFGSHAEDIAVKLQVFANIAAVPLTTYASDHVLHAQAELVLQRIPQKEAMDQVPEVRSKSITDLELSAADRELVLHFEGGLGPKPTPDEETPSKEKQDPAQPSGADHGDLSDWRALGTASAAWC